MDEEFRTSQASDEAEDEDVEAHKKMSPAAAEEQGEDTDGDDDFELHKKMGPN